MAIGDYTDQQVRAWMQGKSPEEIAAKAASLNLNSSQIQDALRMTGQNYSTNDIQNYATQRGYKWDQNGGLNFRSQPAAEAYADSQRGQVGGRLHDFVTNRNIYLGNETDANAGITPDQVQQWFAQNPNWTPEQIGQLASKYHMTPENVAQAISIGTGAAYNPQKVRDWIGNQSAFRIENDGMISAPGHRSNGFNGSADGRKFGQYGPDGQGYADGVDPALGNSANFSPYGNNGGQTTTNGGTLTTPGVGGTSIWSTPMGTAGTTTTGTGATGSIYQPGQIAGTGSTANTNMGWGNNLAQPYYNTPMLNALYNAQQQRMTTPAPRFNFQATPGALTTVADGVPNQDPQGALTQAIVG